MCDKWKDLLLKASYFTSQPPCCLQFCPSFQRHLILGTYDLKGDSNSDQEQLRDGALLLCEVEATGSIKAVQTVITASAVLDIHFSPLSKNEFDLLGVATSTGQFELYLVGENLNKITNLPSFEALARLSASQVKNFGSNLSTDPDPFTGPKIQRLLSIRLFDQSTLITSFDWDATLAHRIICTTTEGQVAWYNLGEQDSEQPNSTRSDRVEDITELPPGHDLEAWITIPTASFYEHGVISGGDDAKLIFSPLASHGDENASTPATQWIDRRTHGAGVTALTPLIFPEGLDKGRKKHRLLLTGSYDDHIRLLRLPSFSATLKRPEILAEKNLGGGVWRISIVDSRTSDTAEQENYRWLLLVSCMYAGACVIELQHSRSKLNDPLNPDVAKWLFEEICWFKEHESMCYASALVPRSSEEGGNLEKRKYSFISTSFYDKRICHWSIECPLSIT